MTREIYILACAAALMLAACGPTNTVTPLPLTSPSSTAPQNAPAGSVGATQAPSAAPQPQAGSVALQVTSPQDGAVVNASQLQVTGTASPDAVVTVNDAIILVGQDGTFETTVSLDEGPNLIEVIASNTSGSDATIDLTVTYAP